MTTKVPTDIAGKTFKRLVAVKKTSNFREATELQEEKIPETIPNDFAIVKIRYAGIQASDVNFTAGRYDPNAKFPIYPGLEGIGTVVAKGDGVSHLSIGTTVFSAVPGNFSEFVVVPAAQLYPIPVSSPQTLSLMVSGLTAAVALYEIGEMKSGETVLVTAAGGATGVIAVQLAKLAGNHVIGTCSSDEKVEYLKKIGCDRVINYKKENIDQVLRSEYPKGVNLVYESVGGDTFDTCASHLAIKGRLIVVGFLSGYRDQSGWSHRSGSREISLTAELLVKSASVRGFFLPNHADTFVKYSTMLGQLAVEGKLDVKVDNQKFVGLETVADAIDHMYEGKNIGKIVIELPC